MSKNTQKKFGELAKKNEQKENDQNRQRENVQTTKRKHLSTPRRTP